MTRHPIKMSRFENLRVKLFVVFMFEPVLRLPIIIRRSGVFEGTQGSFVRKCSNFLSDWDKRVNVYLSYLSSS